VESSSRFGLSALMDESEPGKGVEQALGQHWLPTPFEAASNLALAPAPDRMWLV
jgi:hypothetical protein